MKNLINCIKKEKKYIITIFIITFIWGIVTHGFMFFNNYLTHDSLFESIATQDIINWKISLGRIFYGPYIYLIRGIVTVPWLIGILSLIFISISAILILKMFKIKEDNHLMNILVPGILTANVTVISLCGTYIHDMDVDMFALLMSVLSVYLWRNNKKGFIFGVIPLLISLGLYQSYISVSITLIIFLSILDLLKNEKYQKVFINGLKAIGMILLSGIIYLCLLKLIPIIFNVNLTTGNYNSIDTILNMSFIEILKVTIISYLITIKNIIIPVSLFNNIFVFIIHLLIYISSGFVILRKLLDKHLKLKSKIMIILLILILPLEMNISRILAKGMSHDLMHYSLWLSYVFALILLNESKYNKIKTISTILIALVLFGNIRLSNTLYMMKSISVVKTSNYMNRVLQSIESYDCYILGQTKVVIIGIPNIDVELDNNTKNIRNVTGAMNDYALNSNDTSRVKKYFKIVLNANVNVIENPFDNISDIEDINNMPVYPNKDSMQYFGDTLVIKLG